LPIIIVTKNILSDLIIRIQKEEDFKLSEVEIFLSDIRLLSKTEFGNKS